MGSDGRTEEHSLFSIPADTPSAYLLRVPSGAPGAFGHSDSLEIVKFRSTFATYAISIIIVGYDYIMYQKWRAVISRGLSTTYSKQGS